MFDKICLQRENCDIQKFDWGEVVWLHEPSNLLTQRLSSGLVKFFPGKKQRQHIHFGEEQILYVISGQGIHMLNGKEEKISEGMLIHCPPYSEHEVINSGSEDLVFLITYTPSKLMEVHQNISIINKRYILDLVEIEVLESIQREISEMLGLSVVIMDNSFSNITEVVNLNKFCSYCKEKGICCEGKNSKTYESSINKLEKVFMCCCNIMTINIPIFVVDEIVGYLKCGHFIINKPQEYEKMIYSEIIDKNIDKNQLLEAYNDISVLPKSRLYALQESLGVVSKLISNIIENNIVEREISEKNIEILKNTKEKLDLEDALKQVNLKLLKSKLTSSLKNSNINLKNFLTYEDMEYPIGLEEQLLGYIKKMDIDACKATVSKIVGIYEKKSLAIYETKDILSELFIALSRIIYSETEDEDTFLCIRTKYRERLKECIDYDCLQKILLEFSEENISILKSILLNGKYDFIQKVNIYIQNNFNQNLTLNFLSGIFFISPNYLSTIFNEKNGMSLKDYINKLRIERAKKYLLETDIKISEISKKVGYSQLSYFGSIFKKFEHCTPNEFRGTR